MNKKLSTLMWLVALAAAFFGGRLSMQKSAQRSAQRQIQQTLLPMQQTIESLEEIKSAAAEVEKANDSFSAKRWRIRGLPGTTDPKSIAYQDWLDARARLLTLLHDANSASPD